MFNVCKGSIRRKIYLLPKFEKHLPDYNRVPLPYKTYLCDETLKHMAFFLSTFITVYEISDVCCHCTGNCPCSWGAPCRKCPKRTGRHHLCNWCPGSWCRWAPINHPNQIRSPVRKNLPRHLLEEPLTLSDKY